MDKLFLDTNILLDFLANREPHSLPASNILRYGKLGYIQLYASTLSFATLLYLLRKEVGKQAALSMLKELNTVVRAVSTSQLQLSRAFEIEAPDFEDILQFVSAEDAELDYILTRNPKHFKMSSIPVLNCDEYLANF